MDDLERALQRAIASCVRDVDPAAVWPGSDPRDQLGCPHVGDERLVRPSTRNLSCLPLVLTRRFFCRVQDSVAARTAWRVSLLAPFILPWLLSSDAHFLLVLLRYGRRRGEHPFFVPCRCATCRLLLSPLFADWMVSSLIKGLNVDIRPYDLTHDYSTSALPLPRLIAYGETPSAATLADQQWNEKRSVYSAASSSKGKKIVSFLPPTAGSVAHLVLSSLSLGSVLTFSCPFTSTLSMFVWIDIHLDAYPSLAGRTDIHSESYREEGKEVMHKLFIALAESKVLVAPGWMVRTASVHLVFISSVLLID